MGIYIGISNKDQAAIRVGATGVQKVYVGDKLVWPASEITPIHWGMLYNWYAATDARNIANVGSHVLTDQECINLLLYCDPTANTGFNEFNTAAIKIKDTRAYYWNTINSTNEFNLNLTGAGYRSEVTGEFLLLKYATALITPTIFQYNAAWNVIWHVDDDSYPLSFLRNAHPKDFGGSIRIVKDSTTLIHGQTGTYTGNDGKIYRTICINGVELLADNLAETKFRTGDLIPVVTDNGAWASLTAAGCCYPNGNILNV